MTEETKVLIQALLALDMSELFTRAIAGGLKTKEETCQMLAFLKKERPTSVEVIVAEYERIVEPYHREIQEKREALITSIEEKIGKLSEKKRIIVSLQSS